MEGILGIFLEEATDTLELWRSLLDAHSERGQADFDALFRCAHNLKGSSRSVGLFEFGTFLHEVENSITLARDGKVPVTDDLIEALDESRNLLQSWVEALRTDPLKVIPVSFNLVRLAKVTGAPDTNISKSNSAGKVAAPAVGNAAPDDDGIIWADDIVVPTASTPEITQAKDSLALSKPQALPDPTKSNEKHATPALVDIIRVPRDKLDTLDRLLRTLSLSLDSLETCPPQNQDFTKIRSELREVQHISGDLVVASVESLFVYLKRVAEDVARKVSKDIIVQLQGIDLLMDKKILDRMKDPLMHVIRNAVDHGLETPEQRLSSGKPKAGVIKVTGSKQIGATTIEIADDGRGIKGEFVLKKALEKGLVPQGKTLSNQECVELILLPGFSTAESLTDISGRGVGMDVVRQSIQSLGGEMKIQSVVGSGTSFKMSFPERTFLVEVILVESRSCVFALPLDQVHQIKTTQEGQVKTKSSGGLFLEEGNDFIRLFSLFDLVQSSNIPELLFPKKSNKQPNKDKAIILTSTPDGLVGLLVDRILGTKTLAAERAASKFKVANGLSALGLFDDGLPGGMLDLESLLAPLRNQPRQSSRDLKAVGT